MTNQITTHKTIESPFTKTKYTIRPLDLYILSTFSKPETPELKKLRQEISDRLGDLENEKELQLKTKKKDPQKLVAIEESLNKVYEKIAQEKKGDESEITNRQKVIEHGTVSPKIDSFDKFLDLGIDGTWLWSMIVNHSEVPANYQEVITELFQSGQQSS
jgi:hypothetical protein